MKARIPIIAALGIAGALALSAIPAGASSWVDNFAGGGSRLGFTVEIQSTITVPLSVQAGGWAQASGWVMDTNADTTTTNPIGYDQVGWIWSTTTGAFHLFAEHGLGSGANVTSWNQWTGPALVPGSSITVALDCSPWLGTVSTWYYQDGQWHAAGPTVTAPGLCVAGNWWSRYTEINAPPGTSVLYTPVTFSNGSEIRNWSGRLLANVGPVEALSPGA
jgi:hypothetical protein